MTWILAKRWALLDGWWPDDLQRQRLEFLHDRGEQELIVCGTAACAQSRDEFFRWALPVTRLMRTKAFTQVAGRAQTRRDVM